MHKGRLEAFSDGVIAIIITIMVLELKVPHGDDWSALKPLIPVFASYVLSFVTLGIWWNNHHHMLQAAHRVDGRVLWANLHLLFWLSLLPFTTGWMGENDFGTVPVALYAADLLMAAIAYNILVHTLVKLHGHDSPFSSALGSDLKGRISLALYAGSVPLAFLSPWISLALVFIVALMWLVPDRRFARVVKE